MVGGWASAASVLDSLRPSFGTAPPDCAAAGWATIPPCLSLLLPALRRFCRAPRDNWGFAKMSSTLIRAAEARLLPPLELRWLRVLSLLDRLEWLCVLAREGLRCSGRDVPGAPCRASSSAAREAPGAELRPSVTAVNAASALVAAAAPSEAAWLPGPSPSLLAMIDWRCT